jgi:hypothetical protein
MAKKNFTDSLLGNNRSKKLDMLVSGNTAEEDTPTEAQAKAPAKEGPVTKEAEQETSAVAGTATTPDAKSTKAETPPKKKRGRKKNEVEKDSFFYTVEKDFLFEVRAAAFWDRRDISEFITMSLRHYMDNEIGESEVRRAVREYKKRLEE